MARPEYPTSIRLTLVDKRRLRKQAEKSKRSLAGLIQMILLQWLEAQEPPPEFSSKDEHVSKGAVEPVKVDKVEGDKPFIGAIE